MSQNLEHEDDAALRPESLDHRHHYPPNVSESNDAQDGSEAIFNMYLEMSLREDKEMVESWNQDAKSILLFSGLFSATVAALGPNIPSLSVDHWISSNPKAGGVPVSDKLHESSSGPKSDSSSLGVSPRSFELINLLWYTSLVISLTCALLATLLQQWARRYLMAVRQRGTLYNQARIREFLAEGIRDSGIALLVDVMWASHQISFLLFIVGLLVYFGNIGGDGDTSNPWQWHNVTFVVILTWSVLWLGLYLWASIAGILRRNSQGNSPYYTPLTSLIHRLPQLTLAPMTPYALTRHITQAAASNRVDEALITRKAIEKSAQELLQGLDSHTLKWTFNSLNQDHEFERFFAGIPDFCNSRAVINPVGLLLELNDNEQKLSQALIGLMHRTMTSHLISEPTRQQRINICTRAIDALPALVSGSILRRVFGEWEGLLGSVDSGSAILRMGGDRDSDPRTAFYARCIVAIVIARGQVYGDRWESLSTQFLTSDMKVWDGISRFTLCDYLGHGYSALLANLIFITRTILRFHFSHSQNVLSDVSSRTLREVLSNIDVRLASPEMQREYCRLWDDLVQMAQDGTSSHTPTIATEILRRLRKSYVALHESTDTSLFYTSPDDDDLFPLLGSSYPLCNIHNHRTSPQTQPPTTANSTSPHSPRLSLSPQNTPPQNVVAGATEDPNEVSLPAQATPSLAVAPSAPTAPRSPLDTQPSVEILPTLLSTSDAPVAQSDRISSNLESPSLTPDVGPSAAVPNTNI